MNRKSIDVVEQFAYNSLSESYNRAYRQWRKSCPSKYAYRYTKDLNETVFMDGAGFLKETPGRIERRTLMNVSRVLGTALILLLVCEMVGLNLLCKLFTYWGYFAQIDFLTMEAYGSQWSVVLLKMLSTVLKYAVSLYVLQRAFRFPPAVYMPVHETQPMELLGALGLGLGCGAFTALLECLTGESLLDGRTVYDLKSGSALVCYAAFELLAHSLLTELLLRGGMLQVLRQFGDKFALIATAAVSLLLPNALCYRLGEFAVSLLAGYMLLRSGSLLCAWMVRLSYFAFLLGALILSNTETLIQESSYFDLVTIVGCVLILLWLWFRNKSYTGLKNRSFFLKPSEKLLSLCGSITMLPWLAITCILSVIQLCL